MTSVTHVLEWVVVDGNPIFDYSEFKEDREIYDLEVEFSGDPYWDNDGIGGYEWWGATYYDKGNDYVMLDSEITWEKEDFSEEQNKVIEKFLESRGQQIDSVTIGIVKKYEKESREI